jgi:hypothetical protein
MLTGDLSDSLKLQLHFEEGNNGEENQDNQDKDKISLNGKEGLEKYAG